MDSIIINLFVIFMASSSLSIVHKSSKYLKKNVKFSNVVKACEDKIAQQEKEGEDIANLR